MEAFSQPKKPSLTETTPTTIPTISRTGTIQNIEFPAEGGKAILRIDDLNEEFEFIIPKGLENQQKLRASLATELHYICLNHGTDIATDFAQQVGKIIFSLKIIQ